MAMLSTQPMLSDKEWALIVQLLESERRELPVEMRHTDSQTYAEALDDRRMLVTDLLQRLHAQGLAS